jgi:hypothetical protein
MYRAVGVLVAVLVMRRRIRVGDGTRLKVRYIRLCSDEPRMDRVTTLLAQFPGPVTLAASKWKWWGLLVVGALFTGDGIAENIHSGSTGILDWFGVIFFGMLTAGGAVGVFLGHFEMTLDRDGFTCRVARRSERWRWDDVGDFAVVEYVAGARGASLRKRVGFNDKRPDKGMSQRLGEGISDALTGRDCFLPDPYGSSSFGLPMEDLTRLMSQWQERAHAVRRAPGT